MLTRLQHLHGCNTFTLGSKDKKPFSFEIEAKDVGCPEQYNHWGSIFNSTNEKLAWPCL